MLVDIGNVFVYVKDFVDDNYYWKFCFVFWLGMISWYFEIVDGYSYFVCC